MFAYLVVAVIIAVAAIVLAPKPPEAKPASLDDINVPTAQEGSPVAVVFGTCVIRSPNIVWYGDLGSKPVKSKGGK